MDSTSFKKQNIIIDCKLKGTKHLPPNINKLGKNKIKKIKYFYVDSSEKTKDETWNKLEKNNDNKSKKQKENYPKKKFSLMDKSPRKNQYYNYLLNDNSDLELTLTNPSLYHNLYNFKNLSKDSFSYLVNYRAKTLDSNEEKKYKIKLNILNDKEKLKKGNSNKQKSNYNLNSFNEDDLFKKIKNINFEKYISNCYKNLKVNPEERNNIINDKEQIKNSKKRNINPNNIIHYEKNKNLVVNNQSKMKAYTHMSEKIKTNILEKRDLKKDQKKQKIKNFQKNNSKKLNIDIRINNNNYSNSNKNTTTDINKTNYYSTSNKDNINLKLNLNSNDTEENENDKENNNDFLDIPQRRPGCSIKKKRNEIIIDASAKIDHEKLRKSELLIGIQPRTTFTKAIKRTQKLNNLNNKILKQKEKSNLTNKLINSIIKKFRTQRFNISSYNKIKNNRNKFPKKKETNYINFINIQEKLSKTLVKNEDNNYGINKELNFALLNNNIKDNSSRELTLKNHSFSRGFNTIDNKNKRSKNSVIKRINHYIKNEKILTNNYKKSFTDFHTLKSHKKKGNNEKE
jgi:hypothetical protein